MTDAGSSIRISRLVLMGLVVGAPLFGSGSVNFMLIIVSAVCAYDGLHGATVYGIMGALIVTEAGGQVTTIAGESFRSRAGSVLASNGRIHRVDTELFGSFELKNIASPIVIGEIMWGDGQRAKDPRTEQSVAE